MTMALLLVGILMSTCVLAGNTFTEDYTRQAPLEVSLLLGGMFLMCAILERVFHLVQTMNNKYVRFTVETINEEVMIVGVLVLALTFAQGVYSWPESWVVNFKLAMLTLLLMVLLYVVSLVYILVVIAWYRREWAAFEVSKMDSSTSLSYREGVYRRTHGQFWIALEAYGYTARMGIAYHAYISKVLRRNVVSMADLTWVAWVCLATLIVLNALRTEGTRRLTEIGDEDPEGPWEVWQWGVNTGSFIAVGYVLAAIFLAYYFFIKRGMDSYLADASAAAQTDDKDEPLLQTTAVVRSREQLEDSRSFLFRRSVETSLELTQVWVLLTLWYTSMFFIGFATSAMARLEFFAILAVALAALPPLVVVGMTPRLLTLISMLGALGNNLDEGAVQYLIVRANTRLEDMPPSMQESIKRLDDRRRMRGERRLLRE